MTFKFIGWGLGAALAMYLSATFLPGLLGAFCLGFGLSVCGLMIGDAFDNY